MQVSVITPVFNAESFVRKAVESALSLPETREVLLVEDYSTDDSLTVCRTLKEEYPNVRLIRHPHGCNMGAGASRNLGIINAKYEFIAFLDADDFYLPDRFATARRLFESLPDIDGVYEAISVHFVTEKAKQKWIDSGSAMMTTMSCEVPPEELFQAQSPVGNKGYAHLDGWVVKKSVFEKTGLFDERLRLHQDAVMFVKFAAMGKMVPGSLSKPVAMRGVHDSNRITARRSEFEKFKSMSLMWGAIWCWSKNNLTRENKEIVLNRYMDHLSVPYKNVRFNVLRRVLSFFQCFLIIKNDFRIIINHTFWKRLLSL